MNPIDTQLFSQAVAAAQEGLKLSAYEQLSALLKSNPNEPHLLLWVAFTSHNLEEARQLLTYLVKIDKNNPQLGSALIWLAEQEQSRQTALTIPKAKSDIPTKSDESSVLSPQSYTNNNAYENKTNSQSTVQAQLPEFADLIDYNTFHSNAFETVVENYRSMCEHFAEMSRYTVWEILTSSQNLDVR